MKKKPIALIGLSISALAVIHFFGGQLGGLGMFIEYSNPRLISTSSWVRSLESDPTAHGYSVYNFLEERGTDAAVDLALTHIKSDDPYLWLNAATYLGSRSRNESIPYLIKAIRHTAWRSADERIEMLRKLSRESIDSDFEAWKMWYLSTSPSIIPDWDTSLGHSPKLAANQSR
tara:strand:- start:114 stop:635 length:522 start_codon:yes stop_codon:yes gene_type:complete